MRRRCTVLLMVGAIVIQAFYNVWVTAYWLANRAYIAATLCENRDKPQLHCDGKCYLAKKLAAHSSKSPSGTQSTKFPELKAGIEDVALMPSEEVFHEAFCFGQITSKVPAAQKEDHKFLLTDSFFHPPA